MLGGNIVQNLSDRAEFIVVISLAFAHPTLISLLSLVSSSRDIGAVSAITDSSAILLMCYQILFMAVIWAFLRARQWEVSDLGFQISWKTVGAGILVFLMTRIVIVIGSMLFSMILTEKHLWGYGITHYKINALIVIMFLTVNSIYEEGLVTGYVVTALSRNHSASFAINISTGIRFLYHLYQGPIVVVTIIPMGLLYAYVYARWKRLVPLIVGHTLVNLVWFIFQ